VIQSPPGAQAKWFHMACSRRCRSRTKMNCPKAINGAAGPLRSGRGTPPFLCCRPGCVFFVRPRPDRARGPSAGRHRSAVDRGIISLGAPASNIISAAPSTVASQSRSSSSAVMSLVFMRPPFRRSVPSFGGRRFQRKAPRLGLGLRSPRWAGRSRSALAAIISGTDTLGRHAGAHKRGRGRHA
jgi:hypothetical protein